MRLIVVGGISAVMVLAGLAWAWHWRTHPEVFPGDGNGYGGLLEQPQRTMYFGVTDPYPGKGGSVTLESASPRTVKNTANASFEFYVCTLDVSGNGYSAFGAGDPRQFASDCAEPIPVTEGTVLDVGADPPQQLVMGVTVRRPGVVRTLGVDLTYSHGWQHGTQAVGAHLRMRSR